MTSRRRYSAPIAFAGLILFVVGVSCDRSIPTDETRRSALVGDPIESIQQVEGVAPVKITNVSSPPDGGTIESTSFTIGLFDEDWGSPLCPTMTASLCYITDNLIYQCQGYPCCEMCGISAHLNPAHPEHWPFPPFDDVSVVEVAINVGQAEAMHWDWHFNSYHAAPFGEFSAEVVEQNGQSTTVIDKTGAPEGYGFQTNPFHPIQHPFHITDQHVDLDLSPWSEQKIKVRFILHTNYNPEVFNNCGFCSGFWDVGSAKAYVDNLKVDACTVTSVDFEATNSALDSNPSYAGGGKRIFPDHQSPNDRTDRSGVNVVVRSQPGCKINLLSLDVDDATNDSIIDANGAEPNDNDNGQGDCGIWAQRSGCEASVNIGADGTGRTEFKVTDLPGANFVIVADRDVAKLRGITTSGTSITWSDGNKVPDNARTPLLTVWRRLHIERDAMVAVTGNHVSGRIVRVDIDKQCVTANAPIGIEVDALLVSATQPLDNFQNGRLVAGGRSIPVVGNLANLLCVGGDLAALRSLQGQAFTLFDDDDFNLNDGLLVRGDEGEALRLASTFHLQDSDNLAANVLAAAYIRPTYDIGTGTAPFMLNIPDYNKLERFYTAFDNVTSTNDPEFWTVYLLGAYQGTETRSYDPDGFRATRGVSDRIGQGSLIFLETTTDINGQAVGSEHDVVAHEIGHTLCADHGDGGLMGDDEGGIGDEFFSSASIVIIRSGKRWNGGCP